MHMRGGGGGMGAGGAVLVCVFLTCWLPVAFALPVADCRTAEPGNTQHGSAVWLLLGAVYAWFIASLRYYSGYTHRYMGGRRNAKALDMGAGGTRPIKAIRATGRNAKPVQYSHQERQT